MREIKFRMWQGSKMEYDILAGRFGVFYINPGKQGDGLDENDKASLTPFNTKYHESSPPVMQYTGLKDKNGKEIYEGDIVTTDYPTVKNMSDYWVVEFGHTGMFQLYAPDMHSFKESIHDLVYNKWKLEVLGNIYENPELLS